MNDDALLAAIREIVRDELHAALERRQQRQRKEPDAATIEILLRGIVDARLDRRFTAGDALELAQLTEPECEALRAAIIGAVGVLNSHKLTGFLKVIVGKSYGGLSVYQEGRRENTATWTIRETGG